MDEDEEDTQENKYMSVPLGHGPVVQRRVQATVQRRPASKAMVPQAAGWGQPAAAPVTPEHVVRPEEVIALDDHEFGKY